MDEEIIFTENEKKEKFFAISAKLDEEEYNYLIEIADKEDRSVTGSIRHMIKKYYKELVGRERN